MMPPFSGQLQIAETGEARALSIDGRNWELQFRFTAGAIDAHRGPSGSGGQGYKYTAVASISPSGLTRHPLHPFLDSEPVTRAVERLYDVVSRFALPYASIDRFEYWLLDQSGHRPLALLHSCISEEEIGASPVRPAWKAMPAAQLRIEETADRSAGYVPPVNARLESLIAKRAGPSPHGDWFDRAESGATEFPPCLISEDWEHDEQRQLCQLYIRRLAPRLLMLQGLTPGDRQRLEQASRDNALDVERFYPLYPEVIDRKMLQALRVEAHLRRNSQSV